MNLNTDTLNKYDYIVYTDGACIGNPGAGGWAAILFNATGKRILTGAEEQTTNNRMELIASIQALKFIKIKSKINIFTDSKEIGIRKILNFGHTFAHAYEATLGYSNKLNHGEAVILGIKTAAKFSLSNKILSLNEFKLIENHLNELNLPRDINKFFSKKNLKKILFFMKKDKKNNTNKINLVLLKKIGKPIHNLHFNKEKINSYLNKELFK